MHDVDCVKNEESLSALSILSSDKISFAKSPKVKMFVSGAKTNKEKFKVQILSAWCGLWKTKIVFHSIMPYFSKLENDELSHRTGKIVSQRDIMQIK